MMTEKKSRRRAIKNCEESKRDKQEKEVDWQQSFLMTINIAFVIRTKEV